jgi:hypothetical protein
LKDAASPGYAIKITAQVQNPPNFPAGAGQWAFLQLSYAYYYWYIRVGGVLTRYALPWNDTWGLDTAFPASVILNQAGVPLANTVMSPGASLYSFVDDPEIGSNDVFTNDSAISMELNGYFKTYIMYQPPGVGSAWVPLAEYTWEDGAAANDENLFGTWEVTKWWPNDGSQDLNPLLFEPQWTQDNSPQASTPIQG